jgi:hypothetical protein
MSNMSNMTDYFPSSYPILWLMGLELCWVCLVHPTMLDTTTTTTTTTTATTTATIATIITTSLHLVLAVSQDKSIYSLFN